MDANQFNGSDDRDTLGYDPLACDECECNPGRCETHCLQHGKPLVIDSTWGVTGGCADCERRAEADL
jgi:hypothetical protein